MHIASFLRQSLPMVPLGALIVWAALNQEAQAAEAVARPSLLANGDMEQGQSTPAAWQQGMAVPGVEFRWEKNVGHDGGKSLSLSKTVPRYFPIAQWLQVVPHDGNSSKIKVSAWIRSRKVTKAVVDVQFFTADGQLTHQWIAYIGAKDPNDPPVTHDWKEYRGIAEIPPGTKQLGVAMQIYGPGKVWFDDVQAEYVSDETAKTAASPAGAPEVEALRLYAEDDKAKPYFLIPPRKPGSQTGCRLLVVLPGGNGSAEFHPFVKRIWQNALSDQYIVAELVAVPWTKGQTIVWPTEKSPSAGMRFPTEEFVESVVKDVGKRYRLDPRYIFTLGWSSGGPPCYAASLREATPITGTFAAMSVFKPETLPPLVAAKGRAYYILHSPQDAIPIAMAETARRELAASGAKVELTEYEGGHGWHGDVYGHIRQGIAWLEASQAERK